MSDIYLMQGNCIERMKEIPDDYFDMVLADPPYGTTQCKWDSVIPLELMWKQLKRVIKPGGVLAIIAWSSERLLPDYPMLEAKLSATTPGISPFSNEMEPSRHFPRALVHGVRVPGRSQANNLSFFETKLPLSG